MVYRSIVNVNAAGRASIHAQEGEVVEIKDKNSPTGMTLFVRVSGDWLHKLTPDWRPTRWEASLRAAEELERIADGVIDQAAALRAESQQAAEDTPASASRESA